MKLYSYLPQFRRIPRAHRARAQGALSYDYVSVHLAKGEQYQPEFTAINPQNLVPVLEDEGHLLYQSLAIMQYLDETHPNPPLLPPGRPSSATACARWR